MKMGHGDPTRAFALLADEVRNGFSDGRELGTNTFTVYPRPRSLNLGQHEVIWCGAYGYTEPLSLRLD